MSLIHSLLIVIYLTANVISDEAPCGDWEPYRDEKCLKIFQTPGLLSYQDAENFCRVTDESLLLSINKIEKQNFIENYLKTNQIVDYAWIGLKYIDGTYQWSDGAEFNYTNWAIGSPKNDSEYCVQILTDDTNFGEWSDVLCSKKNLVICEKEQLWSMSQLQNTVKSLVRNPVPLGFIYVQLPNQDSPWDIWPSVEWRNVSPDYAGVFFRAEGGNSSEFGEVQEENSPRLTGARTLEIGDDHNIVNIAANDAYSQAINIHGEVSHTEHNLQLKVSGGEVRPVNMAVRIWRRIK